MSLYTEKSSRIQLTNWIKNIKGRSTSSEVDPSILAPKGAVQFKNENIRYDNKIVAVNLRAYRSFSHLMLQSWCGKLVYLSSGALYIIMF